MKRIALILAAASALSATHLTGAIIPISSITTTTEVDNQFGISDLTVGATTYNDLTIGTVTGWEGAAPASTSDFWDLGNGNLAGNPSGPADAIGDVYVTTGGFNVSPQVDFGTTLNDGDARLIFIFERGAGDTATVNPLVGGVLDTSWSIGLSGGGTNFGDTGEVINWQGNDAAMSGTTFTIADFSGGTGTLTNVTGIQISTSGLDTSMVGIAAVPEPSTYALMAGFLALGLVMVRRRVS